MRSLLTQFTARTSACEPLVSIPPEMTAWMLSYRRDIAGVVLMISVNGGTSFLTRRGSRGVREVNYVSRVLREMVLA